MVRSTYANCLLRIHDSVGVKTDSRELARRLTADIIRKNSNLDLSDEEIREMVESGPTASDGDRKK